MGVKICFDLEINGQIRPYEFVLQENRSYRVGRSGEWLRIPDPALSRYHFELKVSGGAVRVHDLTSTNGLFLNGLKLREAPLKNGDLLEFGACRFQVRTLIVSHDDEATTVRNPLASALGAGIVERARAEGLVPTLSPVRAPALFFRTALLRPAEFFRDGDYRQSSKDSLLLIIAVAFVHGLVASAPLLVRAPGLGVSRAFVFGAAIIATALVFAWLMHLMRDKLLPDWGGRPSLALFSFAYLVAAPVVALASVVPGLGAIAGLAFTIWLVFGYGQATQLGLRSYAAHFALTWLPAAALGLFLIRAFL